MAIYYDTVQEAVAAADDTLPGRAAPDGEEDPRWQAMISVGYFVEAEPEAVWSFTQRWAIYPDEDLRTAVATLLLEHLLEYHFDAMIARVEDAAVSNELFADTVCRCWKLGQAEEPSRSARFDRLIASIHRSAR